MSDVMNNIASARTQLDPHVVMQVLEARGRPLTPIVADDQRARCRVRRCESRPAARHRAGHRRKGVGSTRHHLQYDRARRRSEAAGAHHDAQPAERNRLRQGRTIPRRSGRRWKSCSSPTTTSRSSRKPTGRRLTAWARAPSGWRPSICPRSSGVDDEPRTGQRPRPVRADADRSARPSKPTPKRADEIAADMEALAEDLLMSGAYDDAERRDRRAVGARCDAERHRP